MERINLDCITYLLGELNSGLSEPAFPKRGSTFASELHDGAGTLRISRLYHEDITKRLLLKSNIETIMHALFSL
jgi:hypothetical protein